MATQKSKTAKKTTSKKKSTRKTRIRGSSAKKVHRKISSAKQSVAKKIVVAARKVPGLKGDGLLQAGQEQKLELRDRLGMPRHMFARVVAVGERTIAKVESEGSSADKLKRPYNELYRLVVALSEVVEPASIGLWLQTPNDAFDGLKPMELIERGESDRLWRMIFELQSGMPG